VVGNAPLLGSPVGTSPRSRAVAIVPTADGGGYWVAKRDGAVYHYGNAGFLGDCLTVVNSCGRRPHTVAMAGTGFGGYWLVMARGLVAPFGAPSYSFPVAPAVAAATDP
jgi:hypothetical protein